MPSQPPAPPQSLRERLASFLVAHSTLTLATVGPDGAPAAAAVFFAAGDDFDLYFLSEEKTLHEQNLAANPACAATIQADNQDWRSIRGLQLRGTASPVLSRDLPRAWAVYGARFAFVAAALAADAPGVLAGPLRRARLWVLRPTWIRLIDNTVRFGHKEVWRREDEHDNA